jgi:hypothetical protein
LYKAVQVVLHLSARFRAAALVLSVPLAHPEFAPTAKPLCDNVLPKRFRQRALFSRNSFKFSVSRMKRE